MISSHGFHESLSTIFFHEILYFLEGCKVSYFCHDEHTFYLVKTKQKILWFQNLWKHVMKSPKPFKIDTIFLSIFSSKVIVKETF